MNIPEELAHRRAAEAAIKKRWEEVAMDLASRIPKSCREYATCLNWIRSDDPEFHRSWRLPISLYEWIDRMERMEFGLTMKIRDGDLEETGFVDAEDALKKLRSLQRAWKDHIRITFQCDRNRGKIDVINMTFYVRGIEKKEG
ncbi:hypothetical protein A2318_02130 [Candidatus Uhrbacteria bacterium RIFOXYB2_FULL_45_11]|uniref:Uncharacterized protein n=1 Tax=Candidatus Uhrbacteria bacterium RIFOXYB2_FULL_45_11 TaxID=1802421 RepID=A0A1F7W7Q5_9BACT|nr:MAG: hypothetical protein A2318_02130 [Candidatus Uhrbacteria bacterium RIFOXYB2_FULL_45_11]